MDNDMSANDFEFPAELKAYGRAGNLKLGVRLGAAATLAIEIQVCIDGVKRGEFSKFTVTGHKQETKTYIWGEWK